MRVAQNDHEEEWFQKNLEKSQYSHLNLQVSMWISYTLGIISILIHSLPSPTLLQILIAVL